jgi:hypothetical protein
MKTRDKSLISPVPGFVWIKSGKILRLTSLLVITLGIFLLPKTAFMATITPEKILELTNRERAKAGFNELKTNDRLILAAGAKAQAVLQNQIFDHTIHGQKFSSWIKAAGYQYGLTGENLAIDFVTSEGLMRAWMESPEHRANLLENEYADIGISVAEGKFAGQKTIVVVQIFGKPLIKTPLIPENISRLNEKISPWNEIERTFSNYSSFYRGFLGKLSLLSERRIAMF